MRGEPDQVLTVRETRHGPVISDLVGRDGPILAVSMANLAPDNTAAARAAGVEPGDECRRGPRGRGDDHRTGAEPAGGGS